MFLFIVFFCNHCLFLFNIDYFLINGFWLLIIFESLFLLFVCLILSSCCHATPGGESVTRDSTSGK